jgi:hypothetical protein
MEQRTQRKIFDLLYIGARLSLFSGLVNVDHVEVIDLDQTQRQAFLCPIQKDGTPVPNEREFWFSEAGLNQYAIMDDELTEDQSCDEPDLDAWDDGD